MGNSNSNSQSLSPQPHPVASRVPAVWTTNSYPRDPRGPRARLTKVLPERIPGQRLRVTDNGAILLNGGTISGRRQTLPLPQGHSYTDDDHQGAGRAYRSRSSSSGHQQHPASNGHHFKDGLGYLAKRFGSEPDLRYPPREHVHDSPAKQRITRSRKKYKAPAPPPGTETHGLDSSSPDSYHWDLDQPARRLRLFKTRAETKKHAPRRADDEDKMGAESPVLRSRFNGFNRPSSPSRPLQRSLSSPEFQAELLKATQRLRTATLENANARPTREAPLGEATSNPALQPRGDGSGRESTPEPPPEPSAVPCPAPAPMLPHRKSAPESRKPAEKHWEIIPPVIPRDVPSKTFYFGMEQGEREAVERFAASLHRASIPAPAPATTSGSGSGSGSEAEETETAGPGGIALQLRPTLPKKQLEIPRFSPTAAWRLLSALDAHAQPATTSSIVSTIEDSPLMLEERIQRLSRPMAPPLPQQQAPRSSQHDKSGDSGISGDASPGGLQEDSSEVRKVGVAWTPQQDLEGEEESSSDGGVDTQAQRALGVQPKFSPRAHVFSLSLPRDDRLCLALYADETDEIMPAKDRGHHDLPPSFNSLKKLKRSVGAALATRREDTKGEPLDENWLLSRSVPTSLNSTTPSSPDHAPAFSYLATGGHVMYLPHIGAPNQPFARHSAPTVNLRVISHLSKSCENISASEMRQLDRTPSPELIDERSMSRETADSHLIHDKEIRKEDLTGKRNKGRRFTFQSTVRQIERRRLAERLSKEAEMKERQRLFELEAMRQVEEEFQRKRAREKANIRQQLRLFSLDENLYSSLPAGWGDADITRAEPDGAPASSPASQTSSAHSGKATTGNGDVKTASTQVLSEFREPRREYREYRPASRYLDSGPESMPHLETRRAMVHPQVVYDMPKSTQVYITPHHQTNGVSGPQDSGGVSTPRSSSSDNYRRNFAHGALLPTRSLASSDSELSQPNTRPQSRQGKGHHPHPRHHRSRSASPELEHSSPCSISEEVEQSEDQLEVLPPSPTSSECKPADTSLSQISSCADGRRFSFTSLQPFVRNGKGYRPIVFNPRTPPVHNVAQTVS